MNKDLELLKHIRESFESLGIKGIPTKYQKECLDIIEKKLKALETIKEMLDNHLLEKLNANSRKIFKDIFDNLPKEKQDLLNEVLL